MIKKLSSTEFFWARWRAGSYYELGFYNGHYDIKTQRGKNIIKKYAIGFCDAKNLHVRPRNDSIAVMYFYKDETFWSHLRYEEFNEIFGDINE